MSRSWHWALGIGVLLVLGSCSFAGGRLVDADQPAGGAEIALEPGRPVGQTFVARHAGLAGIEFFLRPVNATPLTLTLHLRAEPAAVEDLAAAALSLPAGATPDFYRFAFSPSGDSHGRYYYAFLDTTGAGVAVAAAGGETYLDGAAYQSHQPLDAQTGFRLVYDPAPVTLDLFQAGLGGIGLLAVAGLLFVVPGWALLIWVRRNDFSRSQTARAVTLDSPPARPGSRQRARGQATNPTWAERLGLAAGVSLALYPLLMVWTHLVGLNLGALYAWLPMGLGLAALAWRCRAWRPRRGWEALGSWVCSPALWPDLALLAVLALVFGVRLLVVRTLEAPLWGDGYQHTLMAQLLADHGGLFDSWEPYTPYRSLTTHFGFSAAAALLAWATGLSSVQATLLTGQVVGGLAALTLYPLAVRLAAGNRWAGVGAVLVAGLLSPMPAYYVNWSRYAQLAGQAILPAALWLLWEVAGRDRTAWRAAVLAGGTFSGMVLAYYRTPLYAAPFVLAWLLGWCLPRWGRPLGSWLKALARLALAGGAAALFLLPWGVRLAGGRLVAALGRGLVAGSPLERVLADYQIWRDVTFYLPLPLLIVALVALAWSLVQRRWAVASVGLWALGLASLVAGRLLHLPGTNMLQNFAVLIALYLPAGLLIGWLVGWVAQRLGQAGSPAVGLVVAALAAWGSAGQMQIVQPRFVMVTRPDAQAMAWIRENTPPQARFLVEGFRIYTGRAAVGSDAGWWLPLLAGRQNTLPPEYALLNEAPAEPDYRQRVADLVARLETASPTWPEALPLLCEWGISHVYIGQRQGRVGDHAPQLFSPADLAGSPAFDLVYQRDRVFVFALAPQACGTNDGRLEGREVAAP